MRSWKRLVEQAVASASHAELKLEEAKAEAVQARKNAGEVEEARKFLQAVAAAIQRQAHGQIALVVSRCLEAVFDDPYEFRIEFEEKRGKTEAKLLFARDGNPIDPMTASGGGVVDVAAFAARMACLLLSRPARRRLLVLDEPFRFVSRDLRPRVRGLLETLAEEMQVQFVLVTHDLQLAIGKVIEVK